MTATKALRALVLVALAVPWTTACSDRATGTPSRKAGPPAVPVTVAPAVQKDVPVQVTAVGTVQAYTTVSVKSQIAGQITAVHFNEGQIVQKGDALYTIDPRPFEAMLRQAMANLARDRAQLQQAEAAVVQRRAEIQQAEANLARDMAQLDNARVQETRYRELVDRGFVAREQYDQMKTNAAAMQATAQADRAAVENAKASSQAAVAAVENARAAIAADEAMADNARLQLAYTSIRAPMEGRTGNILVNVGNIVKANEDSPMVVISQVHPMYVSFSVAEQFLNDIRRYTGAGSLRLEVYPDKTKPPVTGQVTFVNSTVDASTGTIQLKATFTNAGNELWPGQFLDVVLTLTTQPNAVVVPTQAIQAGQQGPFVFVVKPDLTVESRRIDVGRQVKGETVITSGVAAGERVVTDGQLRLFPGAKVDIKAKS